MRLFATYASGAKNTFVIYTAAQNLADEQVKNLSAEQKQQIHLALIKETQKTVDGFLFIHQTKESRYAWDFYNSDGSPAEMCGNAARCAGVVLCGQTGQRLFTIETRAGDINVTVLAAGGVQVEMPEVKAGQQMSAQGRPGYFVNTGVPHFVISAAPEKELAASLRQASQFGRAGSNITFVEPVDEKTVRAVTYERGVEDFTQACGTGAVAAAFDFISRRHSPVETVHVLMPGGQLLVSKVEFGKRPILEGPAQIDSHHEVNYEKL